MMNKQEIMEASLFKKVCVVDRNGIEITGKVKVYETAYDNDEGEASICILTDDGEGICYLESDIESIKII